MEEDTLAGYLTDPWVEWLNLLSAQVSASAFVKNSVSLTSQGASIGGTDFSGGTVSAGLYRLTYYVRVTRAATTSSSIQVSFTWTDDGVALSFGGTILAGNTTTTGTSQSITVEIDASSPLLYSTTYASVGGTSMLYKLDVILEQLKLG